MNGGGVKGCLLRDYLWTAWKAIYILILTFSTVVVILKMRFLLSGIFLLVKMLCWSLVICVVSVSS